MRFDNYEFYGLAVQGNLVGAVDYLKRFPSKKRVVAKYRAIFEERQPRRYSKNEKCNKICAIYADYYRDVFWTQLDTLVALQNLSDKLSAYLNVKQTQSASIEQVEKQLHSLEERLCSVVEAEGYHFLGGKTQGFCGPYIWKTTKRKYNNVTVPDGTVRFPLDMMSGFVSSSWMRFISLGKIGTGGWASKDGTLACITKYYWYKMLTSGFKVDFLKHEAQHSFDLAKNPDMPTAHLEYRAKLVQLIYAANTKSLRSFISEASGNDPTNSHAVASSWLVRNLSRLTFNEDFVSDIKRWKSIKAIRTNALKLFNEYPKGTDTEVTEAK